MAASEFHFFNKMFTTLNGSLSTYVGDTVANVIGAITPVTTTLLAIYVVFWGLSIMRGAITEPVTDGASRIVRLAVITGIALSAGRYNTFISGWLFDAPDAMAAFIVQGGTTPATSVQFLDTLMGQAYDFGLAFKDFADSNSTIGIPDIGFLIMAYAIWITGVLLTGFAAFLLVLAKLTLSITLAIGPIFVLLTIFEATKKFFDAWLGQVLNAVFVTILSAAAIKLILTLLQSYLTDASGAAAEPSLNLAIPAIAYSLVGVLVLAQVPSIAGALGGGVSVGTMGAVSWAAGKAKGAAGSGANLASGKTLSDMRGARRAKAVNARWAASNPGMASKAAGAPMAVYRKVTGGSKNRVAKA